MSDILPKALVKAIDELGQLPGVGARTAERYAYFLLRNDPYKAARLAKALDELHSLVKVCPISFALINPDEEVSSLYSDPDRNKQQVAIVEEPLDIVALERTREYKGTYHVLGGCISPLDGIGPEKLHIPELLRRIADDKVEEVIIATNASVEGESTALYIQKQIRDAGLTTKISRLARGIPVGIDLEYADQVTLKHALEGRREL
ncbi:MAG TPA: recombination mediator RecR [Candidatus Saccharibacteria bacterium]|jgi:recombination protein RecR|nr:recombination mediator RecR [Candidatus Saccharibacteria bacterium]HMR38564.1 recombination mediator RecR [Candidatus Saccharibacteria bacterium]